MLSQRVKMLSQIHTLDKKRYLWFLPSIIVVVIGITFALFFQSAGNPLFLFIPLIYFFFIVPALDLWMGEDNHNLDDEVLKKMKDDPYYRILLLAMVPIYYITFFSYIFFIGTQTAPLWSMIILTIGVGFLHGNVLTIAHELGHKTRKLDRWGAKLMMAMVGYGHFCIEHNRGHHVWVSTPEDPASARMGESIYRFAMRELPGCLQRGWFHERERLERKGLRSWSWRNEILQGYALTAAITFIFLFAFGLKVLPLLILHHFMVWYSLTQANYVEHYGLKRQRLDNGRYEACAPHHSWNTNHIFSNLMTFHLQRHSDHHANPQRSYQILRNFPDLPRLPSGYPGCFGLIAIPPLWFHIMDPKVKAWAGGDMDRINLCPKKYSQASK